MQKAPSNDRIGFQGMAGRGDGSISSEGKGKNVCGFLIIKDRY